ncbi:hypothetical protein [Glycomyces buryatensis]|uniref:Uncharacterized protein n=1 Tax=Glycomyces buryatensis TaxID=2570927 RepID=A0A4S8Q651_9ACTN|nr:hypothetical protein [Glycomyces buryatensis]THV39648.1 hypothetical protein FAB82_17415 [Glycomyces buryatensis]
MGETATAEAGPVREAAGLKIGEFHLCAAAGPDWTYRVYLHGGNQARVDRVFPDPHRGVAEATDLDQYDQGGAHFDFPSDWAGNGNAVLAEAAIVDAYKRAIEVPVRSSIRFGDLVLVMTATPSTGVVRVEEEPGDAEPRWAATLTAPHKDYMQVQVSWSAPDYGDTFGTDPESEPGRSNRLRLARAGSALWRSAVRGRLALPRQARTDDINERSALRNG